MEFCVLPVFRTCAFEFTDFPLATNLLNLVSGHLGRDGISSISKLYCDCESSCINFHFALKELTIPSLLEKLGYEM